MAEETNGRDEAKLRIAECKEKQSDTLDLGGLSLTLAPDDTLWQAVFELTWLKNLYLGLDKQAREKPYWDVSENDEKISNTIDALPDALPNALTLLEHLDAGFSQIKHLPGTFSQLQHLQQLDLRSTKVSDLGPLSGLTSLQQLDLSHTKVSDLGPLSGLTSLQQLDLSHTKVSDLGPLSGLTSLQQLYLSHTRVSDLGPLSGLTSLQQLYLLDTQVSDLGSLSGLTSLQQLNLSNTQVSDLGPLSGLTSLQQLDLSGNLVSDVGPLSGLTSLQQLDLRSTEVSDVGPLSGLTSLQQLELAFTQVSSLGPLSGLTSLQNLNLGSTRVSDLGPLSGLTSLQQLYLSGNLVSDVGPLSGLTSLQQLDLRSTEVSDVGPLSGLTSLKQLNLGCNEVSDLGPLSGLTSLQQLDLWDAEVSDVGPLSGLTSLQELDLAETQVIELGPLSGLTSLQKLKLWDAQVSDLGPLSGLTSLQQLKLWDTQVSDLGPLSGLTSLQQLDLQYTQVSDLGPLSGLTGLQELNLRDTKVSDLGPLSGLTSLQQLNLEETQVIDLGPLSGLTSLQQLNLPRTQVSDVGPLSGLTGLQKLYLAETKVSDLGPLSGLTGLQELYLWGTQVSDVGPLSGLTSLQKLDLSECSLDQDYRKIWFNPALEELFLKETKIPGVPTEILSQNSQENCLKRLRAYFTDLDAGQEAVRDIKFIILGNGRVGKTQICRKLRQEEYDDTEKSTHGIQITSAPLHQAGETDPTRLQIWDFGGQDIYHGTHALFLRSRAIFMAVWTPDMENEETHIYDGQKFRNEPLRYWVNYVSKTAGKQSPLLIVQTRCDTAEDEADTPISDQDISYFSYKVRQLYYSAKTNRRRAILDEELSEAANWLQGQEGLKQIGSGWARVKQQLETWRDADSTRKVEDRCHRTLSYEEFEDLCVPDDVSSQEVLLKYLHDTGIIFYQKDLFDNQIILDQQWALEAIYAVLDREHCYQRLLQKGGRFKRSDLGGFLWDQKYSLDEQNLFLSMMESCGICFVYREKDKEKGFETEYIAPDLLPEQPGQIVLSAWDNECDSEQQELRYELLLPGLIRTILANIGKKAGFAADYWRTGVYAYDANTGAKLWIEQLKDEQGYGGIIRIKTQKGQAARLLEQMVEMVERQGQGFDLKPEKLISKPHNHHQEQKHQEPNFVSLPK